MRKSSVIYFGSEIDSPRAAPALHRAGSTLATAIVYADFPNVFKRFGLIFLN
jgi:hypothetical protein